MGRRGEGGESVKLIKYDHYGVIVLEPDDPEELRADEPDHDDAEAMDDRRSRIIVTPEEARAKGMAQGSITTANGSRVEWRFS